MDPALCQKPCFTKGRQPKGHSHISSLLLYAAQEERVSPFLYGPFILGSSRDRSVKFGGPVVAHVSYVTGGETAVRTLRQCQTRVLAVAGRRRDQKSNRQYRWTHVWQGELRGKQVDRPSPRRAISICVDGRVSVRMPTIPGCKPHRVPCSPLTRSHTIIITHVNTFILPSLATILEQTLV